MNGKKNQQQNVNQRPTRDVAADYNPNEDGARKGRIQHQEQQDMSRGNPRSKRWGQQ